ncbi:MAG: protein kinase [Gammaproteobacteria bacterium RBG_16_57_12]|nr:MAG: protein kinase [Gammaproteobacteria bacterium RBG_16_57_12]
MAAKLSISCGHYSDKGLKEDNQDACGVLVPDEPLLTTKGLACIIADGVSSSAGGRAASASCVQGFLADYYSTPETWTCKTAGQRILGALNRWLHGQGHQAYGSDHGMITTLSALVIKSATAYLFHVGDTRIYRLRDQELECLTRDHQSWAAGEKTLLCRAMGADVNVEIDYRNLPVEVGDVFLLSTDGVHGFVTQSDLCDLLVEYAQQPERCARKIVTRALERGSGDNVTCLVLRIEQLPQQDINDLYRQLTELPFPPALSAGMILDGYKILREVHASKRTQIYAALDTETETRVILKTPSVNYEDDAAYIDRFMHEEWAGRRINSPHVLRVLEPTRRRQFLYYVTEYVEGQTLRQWMNDYPLAALPDVRNIVEQLAAGLRAFHRMEMIHQDLKPENILIDKHGTVKIIDFGSTRIAGIEEIGKPWQRHNLLGTANYTAPEYLQGQIGTHRSDIYALGVIAYEMLCGHMPYDKDLTERNINRIQYISARSYNEQFPVWVDGALAKAVHKNPARRYAELSEFIYDLKHPNPEFLKETHQPLLERNPLAFWKGLALLLLVINILLLALLGRG